MLKLSYSIVIIFIGIITIRYGFIYGRTKQKEYERHGIVPDFKKTPASYGVSAVGAGRIMTFTGIVATCWGVLLLFGLI